MNNSIDNLLEIIEDSTNLQNTISERTSKIEEFKGFGPPDLCYFIREEKGGLFSSPKRTGFYHFVYGADTSSQATVAAYINDTLRQGPNEYFLYL